MCGFRGIRAGGTAERGIHTILTSGQRNRCLEGKEASQTDFYNLFVKMKRRRETKHNYVFVSLFCNIYDYSYNMLTNKKLCDNMILSKIQSSSAEHFPEEIDEKSYMRRLLFV